MTLLDKFMQLSEYQKAFSNAKQHSNRRCT